MTEWWKEVGSRVIDPRAEYDDKINNVEREIGLLQAHVQVLNSPGWEVYRQKLTEKFQSLVSALARGIDMDESQRYFYQGRIMELEKVITDADESVAKMRELQTRLDQLKAERNNLKEQSQPL